MAAALVSALTVAAAAPPGVALKKFEEGVTAFAANNHAEALRLFQASMELEPSPNTRFKIAKCYLALGRTGSAYSEFRRAAKEAQDRINATGEQRFAPTKLAAENEAMLLSGQVPRIALALPAGLPADVAAEITVSLDGSALPASVLGTDLEVDPGPHRVNAAGPRISPYEQSFEIAAAANQRIELAVVRRQSGNLFFSFIKRPVGLAVAIDTQPVASNLIDTPIPLGIGLHKIVVSAPGYLDFTAEKTLHDQETLPVPVNLTTAPRQSGGIPKALTFVLGGTTLALLGIGIGYGVKAQNTADEQMALSPLFRDANVREGVRQDATIANIFFGVSGGFAIATVAIAAATRWRPAPPPKKVANWLMPMPVAPSAFTAAATEGEH
jgi:hypothetical protein